MTKKKKRERKKKRNGETSLGQLKEEKINSLCTQPTSFVDAFLPNADLVWSFNCPIRETWVRLSINLDVNNTSWNSDDNSQSPKRRKKPTTSLVISLGRHIIHHLFIIHFWHPISCALQDIFVYSVLHEKQWMKPTKKKGLLTANLRQFLMSSLSFQVFLFWFDWRLTDSVRACWKDGRVLARWQQWWKQGEEG